MRSHAERVERFFDAKSRGSGSKYAAGGKHVGRLTRFGDVVGRLVPSGGRVLEFGCGSGELAAHLAKQGYAVTGIDISQGMLAAARARFSDAATWVDLASDWSRLPFEDQSFDAVTASSVLEYVPRLNDVLRELGRVTKPGGLLFATVPNVDSRERKLERIAAMVSRRGRMTRVLLPPAVRWYLEYLDLSVNRCSRAVWAAKAGLAGFFPVYEATQETGPLTLLAFRRG